MQTSGDALPSVGSDGRVVFAGAAGTSTDLALDLQWDKDGESLAILQDGNGTVPIWDMASRNLTPLETNLKDPTFLKWSRVGPQLAIGTIKGNLLLYNKLNRRKIPVLGKHPRRITCGAWSLANQLALGSEDRSLTLSDEQGDTLQQTELQ